MNAVRDDTGLLGRLLTLTESPLAALAAAALSVLSFLMRLRGLGHSLINAPDEICHAIVARNFLEDPWHPKLLRHDWFGPEHDVWLHAWHSVQTWLHKPPLPLWSSACSLAAAGNDTFALRLPSAILAAATVFVVFQIGRELVGGLAGLVGAAGVAVLPAIQLITSGLLFSDVVDISLLFWSSLGVLFVARTMRTGLRRDAVLAGVCCGLAYLSKYALGAIVIGVAVAAWTLIRLGRAEPERARLRLSHLLMMLATAAATAGPWILYCHRRFPAEWAHEQAYVLRHLTENIERWGAPWQRLVFDYSIFLHHVFYAPVLAAALVTAPAALFRRRVGPVLISAWMLGVLVPHLFAASKTPSATLPGVPAGLLLFGVLFTEAASGRRFALGALLGALGAAFVLPPDMRRHFWPLNHVDSPPCLPEGRWVLVHVGLALCGGLAAFGVDALLRRRHDAGRNRITQAAWCAAFALAATLTVGLGWKAVRASDRAAAVVAEAGSMPAFAAEVTAKIPADALIIFDRPDVNVGLRLMFYSGRDRVSVSDAKRLVARRALETKGPKIYRATRDPAHPDRLSPRPSKSEDESPNDAAKPSADSRPGSRTGASVVRTAEVVAFDPDSGLSIVAWPMPAPDSAPASRPGRPKRSGG